MNFSLSVFTSTDFTDAYILIYYIHVYCHEKFKNLKPNSASTAALDKVQLQEYEFSFCKQIFI